MFDKGKKDVQVVIPCHLVAPASLVVFIQIPTGETEAWWMDMYHEKDITTEISRTVQKFAYQKF